MKPVWILGGVAILVLGACGGDEKGPAGGREARPRVAFVSNNVSDFWSIAKKGTERAAGEFGVDVEFKMPEDGTAAKQQELVGDLITLGVSGIAISPVDPKNQGPMLKRTAGRVHLVTQDSDAPDCGRLAYVGTDNVAAGRMAGEEIKRVLPGGGKVMLFVGTLEAANARERRQGILEALKGSGIEVLDTRTDKTDRPAARGNAEDTLVTHPDVNCLVGLWSYNGPAILSAVKAAGKVGTVKIVCFDEEDDTLRGVEEGAISATIVQQPFRFGYESVRILAALARGDRSVLPSDGLFHVPTLVIDRAKVVEFREELRKLRG